MDEQAILKKIDTIKEIPTLPTIVFELNTYCRIRMLLLLKSVKPSKKTRPWP